MTVARYIQHAWNRGEVDPLAEARSDVGWYVRSCARARNVITLPLGPARRRGGLRHVSSARGAGRVLPFVFAADERYLLAFSDGHLDVYRNADGVRVWDGAAPWNAGQLPTINATQYADTMLVFQPTEAPRQIVRQSETDWAISALPWALAQAGTPDDGMIYQPQHKYAPPGMSMDPSGVSGAIQVYTSGPFWEAGHVGTRMRLHGGEIEITSITDSQWADADVRADLSDSSATDDWTEQAFSAVRGYPACGKFHKNRLVVAGGARPTTAWLSSARDVFDFNEGDAAADDAVTFTLLGDTLDDIRQVQSLHNNLLFLTVSGEWAIVADVITPETPGATPYTGFGAANVAPLVVEGAVLFLSAPETGRHALLEATWDAVTEGFAAQDVSLVAGHLLEGCTRIAYRQGDGRSAANHVYVVNGDGSVAVLNTLRRQDVTGWSLLTTDGAIRDVAVVGATAYCLTERAGAWSVEAFDDGHYLDASVRATADPPTAAWSGLDHLEGRTVQVRGDGLRLADATVSGGAIATEFAVAELEAGLGYSWELLTLPPPAAQIQRATLQEGWRISHVLVDLYESAAVQVDGQPLTPRVFAADAWDGPVPIVTGQHMAARLGYQDPARVRIHGDDPMPATIRAATFWVS